MPPTVRQRPDRGPSPHTDQGQAEGELLPQCPCLNLSSQSSESVNFPIKVGGLRTAQANRPTIVFLIESIGLFHAW